MAKRRSDSANDTSSGSTSRAKAPRTRRSLATTPVDPAVIAAGSTESSLRLTQAPSEDEIRYRAYFRYLERGGMNGSASDDWLYAEQELKKN